MRKQSIKQSSTPDIVSSPRALFRQPDEALADAFTLDSARTRMFLYDAMLPTLRKWAYALSGRALDPVRGEVVYVTTDALRAFLIRDLTRQRVGHPVTREMLAYLWWRILSSGERAVLTTFAEQGEAAVERARVARRRDAQARLLEVS